MSVLVASLLDHPVTATFTFDGRTFRTADGRLPLPTMAMREMVPPQYLSGLVRCPDGTFTPPGDVAPDLRVAVQERLCGHAEYMPLLELRRTLPCGVHDLDLPPPPPLGRRSWLSVAWSWDNGRHHLAHITSRGGGTVHVHSGDVLEPYVTRHLSPDGDPALQGVDVLLHLPA